VSAVSPSTPVIKASGTVEVDGVFLYQWIIQVPTSITYQSIAGGITTQRRIIELRIVRTPQSESPQGIGILQWIELEGGS
jgi:Type-IV b secretion system, inner-membrane complex component